MFRAFCKQASKLCTLLHMYICIITAGHSDVRQPGMQWVPCQRQPGGPVVFRHVCQAAHDRVSYMYTMYMYMYRGRTVVVMSLVYINVNSTLICTYSDLLWRLMHSWWCAYMFPNYMVSLSSWSAILCLAVGVVHSVIFIASYRKPGYVLGYAFQYRWEIYNVCSGTLLRQSML